MALSLGASGSKSKSKSKSTTDNTFDPTSLGMFNAAHQPGLDILNSQHLTPYTGQLGAGLDPMQIQASQMAQNNVGAGQGTLNQAITQAGQAANYSPQQVAAQSLNGMDLSGYMNPYLDAVAGSYIDQMGRGLDRALVNVSQSAGPGAWGGSRHGVADALTNESYLQQLSSGLNNIYSQGFNNAQGAAQGDIANNLNAQLANQNAGLQGANLGLNAANALAGFGQQQQNMGLADVNAINAFGQQAQATQQNQNQMAYDEFLRQQEYPLLLAGAYNQAAGTVPILVDTKATSKQSGTSVGLQAGYTYSDRRLKTDVEYALTDGKGRRWYDFRYVWQEPDEPKQRGVMAQEVIATDPQAVATDPHGYLVVNYGALN